MARKVYDAHGKGDTPTTSFLAKREDEQSALYRKSIKSVKYSGGVIKDVNKYMTYSIFPHAIANAEESAGRQQRLFVGYLFIYRGISYSLRFAPWLYNLGVLKFYFRKSAQI